MTSNKEKLIEIHIKEIMRLLDVPIEGDTADTPRRVAKMYFNEVFAHRNNIGIDDLNDSMTLFKATNRDKVVIRNIKFNSMCSHHFMPFSGYATIEYVPYQQVIGLSKIPRVVKFFSKKPQMQENLTREIGEYLKDIIKPLEIRVTLHDVKHTCVSCRGIESECEVDTEYHFQRPIEIY